LNYSPSASLLVRFEASKREAYARVKDEIDKQYHTLMNKWEKDPTSRILAGALLARLMQEMGCEVFKADDVEGYYEIEMPTSTGVH
jgi:hypothetical protein